MKYIREHKIISISILSVLVVILLIEFTFGRYIKNIVNNYILETKAFYFNSSILKVNDKKMSISNWDGVNSYTLTIDLNNRKNSTRYTTSDISYNIDVECSSDVICTLNKDSGVIRPEDGTDTYQITVTPQRNFYEGDSVVVKTSVTSSAPYRKSMSATYTIEVLNSDFSYNIKDSAGAKYMTINFINSIAYYEVSEAFGSYSVGDHISLADYGELSASDKDKCFSAIVTVEYDPHDLLVDMTNDLYIHRLSSNYETEEINNYTYVKKFSFKVNPSSSSSIIFYKDDMSEDYTYPIVNNNSIINVTVQKAS